MSSKQIKEIFDLDCQKHFGGEDPYGLEAEKKKKEDAYDESKDKEILKDKKGWANEDQKKAKEK